MPVLTRQDDRAVRCAVQAADGLTVNFGFDGLPLAVQAAERFGQPVGLLRVLRQKQAHGQLSLLHTPGGVDTRREYIADGPGSDLLLVAAAGMDQGAQAQPLRLAQGLKAHDDKAAVLALQRHNVCDRAEADKVAIAPGDGVLIAAERSGQLEGDADTGEHRVRIRPVRPVRVHNGRALRQLLLAFMMVRDDERHAQLPAELGLLQRRDAAVHRDDEPHTLRTELADGPGVQAVALLEPPGDVDDAVRTHAAQKIRQQAGGRDAVHVIIAEHGDALPELQRLPHRLHGAVHLPQEKGVKQRRVRAQQLLRLLRSPAAAPGQHARRQRRIARLLQRIDRGAVRQGGVPDSVLHTRYTSQLGQPRAIAASAFTGYFSPIHRFEKFEVLRSRWRLCRLTDAACPLRVHKVHLHFSNLVPAKNLSLNALAAIVRCCLIFYFFIIANFSPAYNTTVQKSS